MSDHAWAADHIAAFVAGGLEPAEAERLAGHARDCPDCAAALDTARRLDRGLTDLFAPARPGPGLEDGVIRALRTGAARRPFRTAGWPRKLLVGAAATIGVGAVGVWVSRLAELGELPLPGAEMAKRTAAIGVDNSSSMTASELPNPVFNWFRFAKPTETAGGFQGGFGVGGFGGGNFGGGGSGPAVQSSIRDPEAMARETAIQAADRFNQEAKRFDQTDPDTGLHYRLKPGAKVDQRSALDAEDKVRRSITGEKWSDTGPGAPGGAPGGAMPPGGGPARGQGMRGMQGGGDTGAAPKEEPGRGPLSYYSNNGQVPTGGQSGQAGAAGFGYFRPGDNKPADLGKDNPFKGEVKGGEGEEDKPQAKDLNSAENKAREQGAGAAGRKAEPKAAPKGDPAHFQPAPGTATGPAVNPNPAPAAARKVILRSGEIEYEVESFDSAVASVTKLVTAINGAYVGTVNSEKLPNGKVRGSVVVRVPPEHLDTLVLDLRRDLGKGGELKGLRIGSQDVTKQYTDLESRLKAARTMEERLIKIIKEGKGEIKQLLEAERELGVWRTKIEEVEGELRYYANLAALSTLTITLAEKDIKVAAVLTENERVQAGVEVEDVDKAYQQALAAVTEAKGRVTKSEVRQLAAGQFNAALHFEVAPDAAGPMRDRLRQLGRVARLEIDRVQQAEGGTPPKDARPKRGDTVFLVQFYNLANVAPRESATLHVAVPEVPAAYNALRAAVSKAQGRVLTARLDEQDRQNVTAQFDFEVRRADEGTVQAALASAGEVVSRTVTRAPEGDNFTDAKVLYRTTLTSAAKLRPRETTTLALEVEDVDGTAAVYGAQVAEVKGRTVDTQVAHERSGRVTARLVYEVPLAAAAGVVEKMKAAGTVRVHQSARDPQAPDGAYAKARIDVTLANRELIVPKDDGLLPQVRKGLSYSVSVLLVSVTWVIFGLCVVLPWAVVGYGGYRVVRRLSRPAPAPQPPSPPAAQ